MYSYFNHPNTVCMSYYKHLKTSLYYSKLLFIASIKAMVHALFPNIFITSTSDTIIYIDKLLKIKNCNK